MLFSVQCANSDFNSIPTFQVGPKQFGFNEFNFEFGQKNPLELLARKSTLEPKHRRAKDLIQPAFSIPKLKLFVRIELKLCSTYEMGLIQNLCRNLTNDKRRHSQLNTLFEQNRNVHLKKWTASKLYI